MKTSLSLVALAALMTGCAADAKNSMHQDSHGKYASTSDYNSLDRDAFAAAMQAGLRDFDVRLASMKSQADKLGPDAVEEYGDHLDALMSNRREFAAELDRHGAMLMADWLDNREDVAEMYVELREDLDDAYEDVVEEA